jgi:hypothetical protein
MSLAHDPAETLTAPVAPAGHPTSAEAEAEAEAETEAARPETSAAPPETRAARAVPAPPATIPASTSALTDATATRRPKDNPPIPASGPVPGRAPAPVAGPHHEDALTGPPVGADFRRYGCRTTPPRGQFHPVTSG